MRSKAAENLGRGKHDKIGFGKAEAAQQRSFNELDTLQCSSACADDYGNGREGSLFSGGGLLSKAASLAGFKPAFAVELDERYAGVYAENFPEAVIFNQPIEQVDLNDLPPCEVLTIGIPCQPFS